MLVFLRRLIFIPFVILISPSILFFWGIGDGNLIEAKSFIGHSFRVAWYGDRNGLMEEL